MGTQFVMVESKLDFGSDLSFGAYAINTWHAGYDDSYNNAHDAAVVVRDAILALYNDTVGSDTLAGFIAHRIDPRLIHFRYKDLTPTHPVGVDMTVGTLGAVGGDYDMPNQVAVCLTTKCDPYNGYKRQSFYNRQYLGPFTISALGDHGDVGANFLDVMVGAVPNYIAVFDAIGLERVYPAVYSWKHRTGARVTDAWVDNRFDIQRRRAIDPTSKTHVV